MDVRCDKCQARYRIDDARVGPNGLAMRCGKCGNTFKVTKESAAAAAAASAPPPAVSKPAPAAGRPAPAPAENVNATMVFGQAPVAARPAPKPAPVGDGAGSTMMFGQSPQATKPAPKPAPRAAESDAGSTMVFGSAPVLPKPAPTAMPKATSSAGRPAPMADGAGSTMMFGQSPLAAKPPPPPAPKPPPPAPPTPAHAAESNGPVQVESHSAPTEDEASLSDDEVPTSASQQAVPRAPKVQISAEPGSAAGHEELTAPGKKPASLSKPSASEPVVAKPGEKVGEGEFDDSLQTDEPQEEATAPESALNKGPPKKVIIGVVAGVAALLLLLVGVVVVKKMGPKPPPEAAVQALDEGRKLLEKDSVAVFPGALETTLAAIAAAPKSPFGEAHGVHAEIELAWSDALTDLASQLEDKAQKADDDKKKADLTAASEKAKVDAKAHLKAALEATQLGYKADPKSPDVAVALANYYRATRSNSNLTKQLKKATELKADEGKLALVEGLRLLAEDDGAEKALPKLKAALAAAPGSARIQYRIAQALTAMKNDAEALKALAETLKLSPSHERAKGALEALQANSPQQ